MPRISLSLSINLVLFAAVVVLGWKLYDRKTPHAGSSVLAESVTENTAASAAAFSGHDPISGISARLAAIDARLSSIERRQEAAQPGEQKQAVAIKPISPQAAALANERLASVVTGQEFDQNAMVGFNIALAKLPEDEQIALAAALTQAINQGRIKPKK